MNPDLPTIIRHPVPGLLRPLIAGIVGFDETAIDGRFRVQPGGSLLLLEISFTTPLHILEFGAGHSLGDAHHAFLSGFMPGPVRTVFFGRHASVQIYLTPPGASRLFGVSGRDVAKRITPLSDLVPRRAVSLGDRLADAADWRERFEIVDGALLRLWSAATAPDPLVEWIWVRLHETGGQARIADLARSSGWSPRHLTARFTDAAGISPKQAAGVIRFEHVHRELGTLPLAELAARHGFADQSHLSHDVHRYAGESPLALARAERPTAFTAIGTHQVG